jgi:hypothetical protein
VIDFPYENDLREFLAAVFFAGLEGEVVVVMLQISLKKT